MPILTERTSFTLDVMGRYTANTWQEAISSADRSVHPDARPFDFIVIGGGTFGAVLAAHLLDRDVTRSHRILVLEAGPLALPEHVQNLPMLNTAEVWGVPWNSDSPKTWNRQFPGLAYCIGGRSLFWGGWSPYFLDSEILSPPWPFDVKNDLTEPVLTLGGQSLSYLDHAASQLGSDTSNDFVSGPLHEALRDRLFDGLGSRLVNPALELKGHRGLAMRPGTPAEEAVMKKDLEAPLAVQSTVPRPGFFPFNKFSATPLLIRAARLAQAEAEQGASGDAAAKDVKKRLMAVGNTHVIRLERSGRRITGIVTNQGTMSVPAGGMVFLALGTIENTRVALDALPNQRGLIGRNLMAHLRSNLVLRVRRTSFGDTLDPLIHPELQVSALFVKGIHTRHDGSRGHFHVQITASGVGALTTDSEAELFKKIPDIDGLEHFRGLTDEWIVITLRGIGEMAGDKTSLDPLNRVRLGGPEGSYDYGVPRAMVRLEASPADLELWDAMDRASDEIARIFAASGPVQYLSGGAWQETLPGPDALRDTLSSTHHEGGTLWMGDDPLTSVTDGLGLFHEAENLYALGPCLLPTMGSPNPMLSGTALARRTADRLVPPPVPLGPESGFAWLFDGTEKTFKSWKHVGGGAFALVDGAIVAQPDPVGSLGLFYHAAAAFGDLTLRLEFRLDRLDDNSGVFLRFRDPRRPVPDRYNSDLVHRYGNPAFVAVDTGFEVQIDELARPHGLSEHHTGAIYGIPIGPHEGMQVYEAGPGLQAGTWYDVEIDVTGDKYTVQLAGKRTTTFTNRDNYRGKAPQFDESSGYIGLQTHTGRVAFRNVRVQAAQRSVLMSVEGMEETVEFDVDIRPGARAAADARGPVAVTKASRRKGGRNISDASRSRKGRRPTDHLES